MAETYPLLLYPFLVCWRSIKAAMVAYVVAGWQTAQLPSLTPKAPHRPISRLSAADDYIDANAIVSSPFTFALRPAIQIRCRRFVQAADRARPRLSEPSTCPN
jgi:hypothetical protein